MERRVCAEPPSVEDLGWVTILQRPEKAGEARFWSAFYAILMSLGLFRKKYNQRELFKSLNIRDGIVGFQFRKLPSSNGAHGMYRGDIGGNTS